MSQMDEGLHFQRGVGGRLARFFAARRNRGDPYEATLVLPALLITVAMRLNEMHKLPDLAVILTLLIGSLSAGAWIGACLGMDGGFRALMRGQSAGTVEAAAHAALNDTMTRPQALTDAGSLIWLGMTLYWAGHYSTALIRDIVLISDTQWQKGVSRRAWLYRVYRIVCLAEKLEGAPDSIVAGVWAVWLCGPFLVGLWIALLLGISPLAFIYTKIGAAPLGH
jgi:hypothetical protein